MRKALFPGTFDPPTLGHLDIIERAAALFDRVYVAIGHNINKTQTAFSLEERLEFLRKISQPFNNVEVTHFEGLLVDFAKKLQVSVVVRGVRNVTDLDKEAIEAGMNKKLNQLETVYLIPSEEVRLISSTLVRQVGQQGHSLHEFVSTVIERDVLVKLSVPDVS